MPPPLLRRRSWLKVTGASLLTGCRARDLAPRIGNCAVFSHLGLRLFVMEDIERQQIHVKLTNVGDEVFIVYDSEYSDPGWHGLVEDEGNVLAYGPSPSLRREHPMIFAHGPPIAKELRLAKGQWWESSRSLDTLVFLDRRPGVLLSGRLASTTRTVDAFIVRIVAPLESAVGFDGGTAVHRRVYQDFWPQHSVGGLFRLSAPATVQIVEPSRSVDGGPPPDP